MAQQLQQVFKTAVKVTGTARSMSTGMIGTMEGALPPKSSQGLHVSVQRDYPATAALPLPANIDPAETTRFSPQRARDINSSAILTHQSSYVANHIDVTVDNSRTRDCGTDPHIESYDCRGAVNLNSSMQSNVPSPFGGLHKFTHLNMPGGGWAQEGKFLAQDLHSSHYINLRKEVRSNWSDYEDKAQKGTLGLLARHFNGLLQHTNPLNSNGSARNFSLNCVTMTAKDVPQAKQVTDERAEVMPATRKERLKKAVKEYGSTVLVFHVGISLTSLGACYVLVSSGIDMVALLDRLGWANSALASKTGAGAGTFVIAYAIHKVFAPVRISITLGATPFIVRYLRKRGILKPPPPSKEGSK
ncbi:protein FAM210A-like [Wyeomyia smithii]|uniref:protein FAM210A-like n=1 Tax=Wyeomyia smithii TaxID=174621 RepID=UPI002468142C|nr:protein FAM210A-like [Wyeomyia smithii]XP_055542388.1 protein FAM210A-like [Wyeomyia smithii]